MSSQPESLQIDPITTTHHEPLVKVPDFGTYLRKQRMLRGVTHQELVKITKVRACYIEALEGNRFEALPPKTFVLGFVRAIAKYLGLDEEETVAHYLVTLSESSETQLPPIENHSSRFFKKTLMIRKAWRVMAWVGGVMLVFFLITLPHFLRQ